MHRMYIHNILHIHQLYIAISAVHRVHTATVYIVLTIVDAAGDGSGAADHDGLGVVCGDGAGDAQLVQVRARVDHLQTAQAGIY